MTAPVSPRPARLLGPLCAGLLAGCAALGPPPGAAPRTAATQTSPTTPPTARPADLTGALTLTSPRVRYRVGDRLHLRVRAARPLDLVCYYRNARGQLWQVLPTTFQPKATLGTGGEIAIPGTPRYDLVLDTPGTERALCLGAPPGSAARLAAALPAGTRRTDLKPLTAGSLEAVAEAVRAALGQPGGLARADLQVQVE